jgi:hypothetical protein
MKIIRLFSNFLAAFIRSCWWQFCGWEILASGWVMSDREMTCNVCPFRENDVCTKCGCLIVSKIALSSEKCPENFWLREKLAKSRKTNDC